MFAADRGVIGEFGLSLRNRCVIATIASRQLPRGAPPIEEFLYRFVADQGF